ncbi:MAG TPA: zinc-binding dehydrogenase [Candidatus Binatia bacterium]|nr:zinc-binding dehydrogenase [Candidatus Binatia bacterium]
MRTLIGSPGKPGNVEFRDVEPPQPAADEILIDVKAFAMNRGELTLLAVRPAGWRPGQDIAGVVVRGASEGSGPKPGDRVVALTEYGGWSQQATAKAARSAVLPEGVSFEQAASLPVAGLTALRALRVGGALLGKRVLITGASGGVGSFAMQLARDAGAVVTGVSSAADAPDAQFDVILESVGGASLAGSLHRVAADGVVVMYGNSSKEPTTIPGFPDFGGRPHAKLYAFFVYLSGDRPTFGEDLGLLASLIAQGKLKPEIGATFPWDEFAKAYDSLTARKIRGKAVMRVG